MINKLYLVIIICSFYLNVDAQNNSFKYGCYSSNFAIVGWFGTHIQLSDNYTFKYEYSGDLSYDGATGTYTVIKDTIYLEYKLLEYDTTKIVFKDSAGRDITLPKIDFNLLNTEDRPQRLYYKNSKLFFVSSNGKLLKRATNRQGKQRKYYLQRHEAHPNEIWRNKQH
jgi:hypothetical protein